MVVLFCIVSLFAVVVLGALIESGGFPTLAPFDALVSSDRSLLGTVGARRSLATCSVLMMDSYFAMWKSMRNP